MANRIKPWSTDECKPCCGVLPRFEQPDDRKKEYIIVCPICGKRTSPGRQWWIVEQNWNCGEYIRNEQLSFLG